MHGRIGLALAATGLLFACGCVEVTQQITINPDGTTKVGYDMLVTPTSAGLVVGGNPLEGMTGPQPNAKKDTPDDIKRLTVAALLTVRPGTSGGKPKAGPAAWTDVKAEWVKDGRLHVTATAYYAKPDDVPDFGGMNALAWTRDGSNGATLVLGGALFPSSPTAGGAKKEPPPDFAKLTDAEWADFLLEQRVKYQSMKPMLAALFSDLKLTTVLHLPGEASGVVGFKGNGKVVSRELDGTAVQAAFKKFYTQDDAALRAKFKPGVDPEVVAKEVILPDAKVTVAKPGGDQFDYAKEVAAAVAAYPALRKEYAIDPKMLLPGEKPEKK